MATTDDKLVTARGLAQSLGEVAGGAAVADSVYPVGSVYLSTSATDPATLFGGTWQRIQDRFLLCAGTTYAAGSEGGEASHTLTVEEMPSHRHTVSSYRNANSGYSSKGAVDAQSPKSVINTGYAGGGAAHNNMPPYLSVYAWKRVA